MLVAHANTSPADFLAQLRTHVIAFGCSTMVVDCVDNLIGADELAAEHEKDLQKLEDDTAAKTKAEILKAANDWLEKHPAFDLIAAPCEALIKVIEET